MNRFPIEYEPDAQKPARWLSFMSDLLHEEDIATLQEFLGYSLIPTNSGQSMLIIIGNGGEGKSRICAVMQIILQTKDKHNDIRVYET
jgi:putative DNA primase/helicase